MKRATGNENFQHELMWLIVSVLVAHWLVVWLNPSWGFWFDLDREYNIPTAINAVLLWMNGILAFVLATKAKHRIQKIGWALFGILFVYFGFDELLIIHEQLAEPVRILLDINGNHPLYHAWVVPGLFVASCMLIGVWLLRRYHKELSVLADTLLLVAILAGVVIGIEIAGTFFYSSTNVYRYIMIPIEEIFELTMATIIFGHLLQLNKTNKKAHAKVKKIA